MRIGLHERLWEKNVVAIGLAAGFIEPLESNGLFTVHEFLRQLIRELKRDKISQWDRDNFTYRCKGLFRNFAEFVAMHYILSHRDDTEYWRHIRDRSMLTANNQTMLTLADNRMNAQNFGNLGGIATIATGMHYPPVELCEIMWITSQDKNMLAKSWLPLIENLNKNNEHIKTIPSIFYTYSL